MTKFSKLWQLKIHPKITCQPQIWYELWYSTKKNYWWSRNLDTFLTTLTPKMMYNDLKFAERVGTENIISTYYFDLKLSRDLILRTRNPRWYQIPIKIKFWPFFDFTVHQDNRNWPRNCSKLIKTPQSNCFDLKFGIDMD